MHTHIYYHNRQTKCGHVTTHVQKPTRICIFSYTHTLWRFTPAEHRKICHTPHCQITWVMHTHIYHHSSTTQVWLRDHPRPKTNQNTSFFIHSHTLELFLRGTFCFLPLSDKFRVFYPWPTEVIQYFRYCMTGVNSCPSTDTGFYDVMVAIINKLGWLCLKYLFHYNYYCSIISRNI